MIFDSIYDNWLVGWLVGKPYRILTLFGHRKLGVVDGHWDLGPVGSSPLQGTRRHPNTESKNFLRTSNFTARWGTLEVRVLFLLHLCKVKKEPRKTSITLVFSGDL